MTDVREVLQYVPLFAGKIFVVCFDEGLLPDAAVAETLLDLIALQRIGVGLVVVVMGGDVGDVVDWAVEAEFRAEKVESPLGENDCVEACDSLLSRGQAALVDGSGRAVLSDSLGQLACELSAAKLMVLLNDWPAMELRPSISESAIQEEEKPEILAQAAKLCRQGVPRVHLLDGHLQGALTSEIFSNEGVGTMVHSDSYRCLRGLREEDIPEVLAMMGRSVRATHLVPRTYDQVWERREDFLLLLVDDNVVGTVAVHAYDGSREGELACLYVKKSHEGRGYGGELVAAAEEKAREMGLQSVFALTNRAATFFSSLGYSLGLVGELPETRREQLSKSGRDSQVWRKNIGVEGAS